MSLPIHRAGDSGRRVRLPRWLAQNRRLIVLLGTLAAVVYVVTRRRVPDPTVQVVYEAELEDRGRCAAMPWLDFCGNYANAPADASADAAPSEAALYASLAARGYNISRGLLYYDLPVLTEEVAEPLDEEQERERAKRNALPHPIHFLMARAQERWRAKLARQSTTFAEAVAEYTRRYRRAPPRGFAGWYAFAVENGVQLIDEYDSINEAILPFWALPPDVLRIRARQLQTDKDFWMYNMGFTLVVRDNGSYVEIEGPMAKTNPRPREVARFMKGILEYLPDVNLTMTGHDTPWVVISGEARERHYAAAREGRILSREEAEQVDENFSLDGWAVICAPDSELRHAPSFQSRKDVSPLSTPGDPAVFVADHPEVMDVCSHSEFQPLHGLTAWAGPRPGRLFPMFSFTRDSLHNDLLLPALEQYDRPVGPDYAWEAKQHNKVVWRGSTTGSDLTIAHMRTHSQRPRLCRIPQETGPIVLPLAADDRPGVPGPCVPFKEVRDALAASYFDFKFMGPVQQCGSPEQCAEFRKGFAWAEPMHEAEQNSYKYVIDVDGNGWSGRFHRLLSSNTLVLKSTIIPEWYTDRIEPWLHYVPVSVDYSDLWGIMAFFKGDENGSGGHDRDARRIAYAGKEWAGKFWRLQDMQAYFLRLVLEYNEVLNRPD